MAVVFAASVSQGIPVSGVVALLFTDASTGVTGLVSRTLVVTDANNVVIATINMGATLTETVTVTQDVYYKFTETIVDGSGTTVGDVSFLSTSFYQSEFAPAVAGIVSQYSDTFGVIYNLTQAQLFANAAIDMALFGQGVQAQALITQANAAVLTPYYA